MQFHIKIANIIIQLNTIYESTFERCADYLVDLSCGAGTIAPDFSVCITEIDIEAEMQYLSSDNNSILSSNAPSYLEFFAVYRKIAEQMLAFNIFLMHGTVVAVDGKAYMFTAPSGTGKTTHVKMWLQNLPNACIVNGDKPLIIAGNPPEICGTPWAGKEGWQTNTIVPLEAIVLMERSEDNVIEQLPFSKAFPGLLRQTYRPEDIDQFVKTVTLLKSLETSVKVYSFKFNNMKSDSFQTAYHELVKKEE